MIGKSENVTNPVEEECGRTYELKKLGPCMEERNVLEHQRSPRAVMFMNALVKYSSYSNIFLEILNTLTCVFKHCLLISYSVDCIWVEWNIGDCSHECGGGHRIKTRQKLEEELYDGKCEEEASITEECNMSPCPGNETQICDY